MSNSQVSCMSSTNGGCLYRAREEAKVEPYSEIYEEEPTPFDEMYKEASVFGSEVSPCCSRSCRP